MSRTRRRRDEVELRERALESMAPRATIVARRHLATLAEIEPTAQFASLGVRIRRTPRCGRALQRARFARRRPRNARRSDDRPLRAQGRSARSRRSR